MSWLLITTESNPDRWFQKFVTDQQVGLAVAIISDNQKILWVHELDRENIDLSDFEIITFTTKKELLNQLIQHVNKNRLDDIRINYSTVGDESINTISHGLYLDFKNR